MASVSLIEDGVSLPLCWPCSRWNGGASLAAPATNESLTRSAWRRLIWLH